MRPLRKSINSETEDQSLTFKECPHSKDLYIYYKAEFRSANYIYMLLVFTTEISALSVYLFEKAKQHSIMSQ